MATMCTMSIGGQLCAIENTIVLCLKECWLTVLNQEYRIYRYCGYNNNKKKNTINIILNTF